jgi:hypothetical protein
MLEVLLKEVHIKHDANRPVGPVDCMTPRESHCETAAIDKRQGGLLSHVLGTL